MSYLQKKSIPCSWNLVLCLHSVALSKLDKNILKIALPPPIPIYYSIKDKAVEWIFYLGFFDIKNLLKILSSWDISLSLAKP